jgi:hypothetical protein
VLFRTAVLFVILAAWSTCLARSSTPHDQAGHLAIRGVPDDAVLIINGRRIAPSRARDLSGPPGRIQIAVFENSLPVYRTSLYVRAGEWRKINVARALDLATLDIITDPIGAAVSLDGRKIGTTPLLDTTITPGRRLLKINLPGYNPIEKSIELVEREVMERTIELSHTTAWLDSVAAAKKARKRHRQFIQKIAFGSVGMLLGAAGYYYDTRVNSHMREVSGVSAEYDRAQSGFEDIKQRYGEHRRNALDDARTRDRLYGAAAAAGVLFSLSFVF